MLDKGQGGLLDVAVHPDYAKNGWIYLGFSDPGADGTAMTKIVRGKLKGNAFVEIQDIFKAPAEVYTTGPNHFGYRIVFDRKGHIYFSIGERGQGPHAQELTSRTARSTASTRTAPSRRTTRSSASRRRCRRSTPTATATRRG